ncbi:PAPA-1-like conserved region-domain-containing protein [Podospora fimiseda]|uniref:PAPA-1-like conserved region-domain-containing protein n=1 Tax=Podospora fimiseda TaxID=252190 RepID=A0AAN7GWC3_9PEZI|nr:PAPA-1-like conserved region-domain-containing protein [Podospora fimiseda]
MSSRPRRSAAQRATAAITDMADRDKSENESRRTMSSTSRPSRRSGGTERGTGASVSRGPPSSPASSTADSVSNQHIHLTVKTSSSKLREATSGGQAGSSSSKRKSPSGSTSGGSGTKFARNSNASKRTRGGKKTYVVESSDDEDDEEGEASVAKEIKVANVIEVGNRAMDDGLSDEADEMDIDGEGEEDFEEDEEEDEEDAEGEVDEDGDIDMAPAPPVVLPTPSIKVTKPPAAERKGVAVPKKSTPTKPPAASNGKTVSYADDDDDDDDELSDLESEPEDPTKIGEEEEEEEEEEDAEGEEDEVDAEGEEDVEVVEEEDAEGEEDDEGLDDSDELGSRGDTPDLSKLTARQRAKLGEASHEYLKLSDEVQAKRTFTAEELSMRRAEMARRRRNLSEKRNEEVKMETINKLLKKQAPKTNRRAAGNETPAEGIGADGHPLADQFLVRWISTKDGSRVAVPGEILNGPAGQVFSGSVKMDGGGTGLARGKMVEEVA